MPPSKVHSSALSALAGLAPKATLLVGGFGLCGIPSTLIAALREVRPLPTELTVVSNNAGVDDWGLGTLLHEPRLIKRMVSSYVGENKTFEKLYLTGELEVELTPQGTLAERLRAGGAGIPGFYTATGVGTLLQHGGFPIRNASKSAPALLSQPKPTQTFASPRSGLAREYMLETAITGDFALIKAHRADRFGNLQFRSTARNFNPDAARAAKVTVAEVEHLSEEPLPADQIHLPGIYVDRIVVSTVREKRIERLTTQAPAQAQAGAPAGKAGKDEELRHRLAKRASREFRDGDCCNLGIGVPSLAANYIPPGMRVMLQSENGLLGMGAYPATAQEADADLINAGKETVTMVPFASIFSSSDSFSMIRGGHVDLTMLGGLQVSKAGDLANWIIPGAKVKGMGGAMDLCASESRVVVVMEHTAKGALKLVEECSLPLTAKACVDRLITDLAVFDFVRGAAGGARRPVLVEIAEGVDLDQVRRATGFAFDVAGGKLPTF